MDTVKSILEGTWNGIVVSSVMMVCAFLAKSAALFLLT